jgi:hypothetical protein
VQGVSLDLTRFLAEAFQSELVMVSGQGILLSVLRVTEFAVEIEQKA